MSRITRVFSAVGLSVATVTASAMIVVPAASAGTNHPAGHPSASQYQYVKHDDSYNAAVRFVLGGKNVTCWSQKDSPTIVECEGRTNKGYIDKINVNKQKSERMQSESKNIKSTKMKSGEKYNLNGTVVQVKSDTFFFSNPHYGKKGQMTSKGVKFTK